MFLVNNLVSNEHVVVVVDVLLLLIVLNELKQDLINGFNIFFLFNRQKKICNKEKKKKQQNTRF